MMIRFFNSLPTRGEEEEEERRRRREECRLALLMVDFEHLCCLFFME